MAAARDAQPPALEAAPPSASFRSVTAARDIRDATLVKERDLFLLADLEGNVPLGGLDGHGLYYRDTRHLSAFALAIEGLRPTILLSSGKWHFLAAYVLANPSLVTRDGVPVPEQSLQIRRYRIARPTRVSESLTFQNFNPFPVEREVSISGDADFADIFDVRGLTTPERPRVVTATREGASLGFSHDARDGVVRSTRVRFEPPPASLDARTARYRLALAGRGSERVTIEIDVGERPTGSAGAVKERSSPGSSVKDLTPPAPLSLDGRGGAEGPRSAPSLLLPVRHPAREAREARIRSSNALFDAVLRQARADLRALIAGEPDAPFVAAGIPWYAALFGRDSLVTSLQDLWLSPALARSTLGLLARAQGRVEAPERDEEPGKILHELRRGELARAASVPFGPYYGTVDATPLWIVLLAEYHRVTADLALVSALRPNLEAALGWIDRYGDRDGDGFVEYGCRAQTGLVNQGWKDSWDGVVHADGTFPAAPIALVEAQAYAFAAKRGAARLFDALGEPTRARTLEAEAERLRVAFEAAFWMPSERYYCLALDGRKRQVAAIASNAGHALWAGIASDERAALVAERLLSEELYSGFGVRTLSSRELRYNPAGYHLGTVWPHDNAILALGLARYGCAAQAAELATGLFDATVHFPSFRTPELFCGFARSAFSVPVRYPVACCPQAWAAGAWSMLLQAILGATPDALAKELLVVRPQLPSWLSWVEIEGLAVGDAEVDLRCERVGERTVVDVMAMRGDVRVTFSERWAR
jgi:glycogen debranching enzyme